MAKDKRELLKEMVKTSYDYAALMRAQGCTPARTEAIMASLSVALELLDDDAA